MSESRAWPQPRGNAVFQHQHRQLLHIHCLLEDRRGPLCCWSRGLYYGLDDRCKHDFIVKQAATTLTESECEIARRYEPATAKALDLLLYNPAHLPTAPDYVDLITPNVRNTTSVR